MVSWLWVESVLDMVIGGLNEVCWHSIVRVFVGTLELLLGTRQISYVRAR